MRAASGQSASCQEVLCCLVHDVAVINSQSHLDRAAILALFAKSANGKSAVSEIATVLNGYSLYKDER